MQNFAVSIKDVNKNYIDKKNRVVLALKGVSFDVKKGSCCGLLGPNGAGKSTLINILGGSVVKNSGHVSVLGHDLDESPYLMKKKLGIVPQELTADVYFSVFESLEMQAGYYGIRAKNRKTKEILEIFGLLDKQHVSPRGLSGGMMRRFLVAKALVHSPDVVILDEPTAGVDVSFRDQLWSYIKKINNLGTTIILTTHYFAEAQNLCDHFVFINNGKIVSTKRRDEVFIDDKEVVIKYEGNLEMVPNNLLKYAPMLDNVNHSITFSYLEHDMNELLRDVSSLEVGIKNIATTQKDLEAVFREIVYS